MNFEINFMGKQVKSKAASYIFASLFIVIGIAIMIGAAIAFSNYKKNTLLVPATVTSVQMETGYTNSYYDVTAEFNYGLQHYSIKAISTTKKYKVGDIVDVKINKLSPEKSEIYVKNIGEYATYIFLFVFGGLFSGIGIATIIAYFVQRKRKDISFS